MDIFMGSIMTFGFNFAPYQWQLCNGQTLSISQYSALFALLGTSYGGNGTSTFQLPNLQGRTAIGQGNGAGLTPRVIGESSGAENVSITINNLPSHTHIATFTPSGGGAVTFKASSAVPPTSPPYSTAPSATNNVLAASPVGTGFAAQIWAPSSTVPNITVAGVSGGGGGGTVSNALTGNNVPTPSMNPYLALNFSIAMYGLFPSRN
jgi:microcystin-dependent protein